MSAPPPPPPPGGGSSYGGGGYYGSNAGTASSSAARQRLGLPSKQQQRQRPQPQTTTAAATSSSDDWFASTAAPAPAPAAPAAAPGSGSGFYSMNTAAGSGGGDNLYGSNNYGASSGYSGGGGGGGALSGGMSGGMSAGANGGGYYGSSSGATSSGYGASSTAVSGGMSGTMGGASSNIPPASAFGSNPNSGSSGQMSSSWDTGGMSGGMTGGMSGAMGGPIGGAPAAPTAAAPTPHVFDPNAAAAKKKADDNALHSVEEDYDNEPPLLEELGVNFPHIYSKSRAVLFPFGKHARGLESGDIENDADLAGPLAFALGLGGELLLSGKLHFGYVYGFGVSGSVAMTLLMNLLNPHGAVSFWTVLSILGYALLPVNLLAGINAIVRIHKLGQWGMLAAILTVGWCTAASARLFERGCNMRAQRFLVAYPTALLYTAFVMITIF
ncbi:hypothetical protein ACHAXT_010746 [Thalassiosira profunda]